MPLPGRVPEARSQDVIDRVIRTRRKRGWSLERMAAHLGMSASAVWPPVDRFLDRFRDDYEGHD